MPAVRDAEEPAWGGWPEEPDPRDEGRDEGPSAWSHAVPPDDPYEDHPGAGDDRPPGSGGGARAERPASPAGAGVAVLAAQRPRIRLRTGIGAAVVLVLVALVGTILVTALSSAGETQALSGKPAHTGRPADARPSAEATAPGSDAAGDSAASGSGAAGVNGSGADASGTGASGAQPPIYVHVVGAVVSPGLYPLAAGSRVVDALAAAHGFAEGADTSGVNLARVLSDGEQLVVPKQGEAPSGAPAAGSAGGATGTGGASATAPVNLNTATAEQLETLPRVGPAMAQRIIAWRTAHGRFARVADLAHVPGIGERTLASLTPLVRV